MKKLFTLIALVAISYTSMAQWLPQASGFTAASRGIKYLHAVNDQVVWATAYDGTAGSAVIQEFTRTINGGELWVPGVVNNAAGLEFAMIFGIDANTAFAAMYKTSGTNPQGIYKTTNGGTTWTHQATALFNNASSFTNVVHFFDANNGFAQGDPIGGEFELYTTTNGGTTWTAVPGANIPNPVSGEWGIVGYYSSIGDNIWFGTNKGRVFRSSDKGLTWAVSTTSLGATFVDVEFANELHGLAQDKGASSTGTFAETFDGGVTWANISASGPTLTNDFTYVPGTEMTFVATGAATGATGVAFSYDGGHNWEYFPDTEATQFLATDFVDPETGWAGGFSVSPTEGGMYKFNGSLMTPEPPTNLQATVVDQTVTLTWDAPVNLGSTFLGYTVWRNTVPIATLVTETTYVDDNLASGAYAYMVTAVYENGESSPSNTVEVEITGGGTMTTIKLDFEDQEDFSLTFGDWTTLDVDGSLTYGFDGITFPHSGEAMSYIAFNPLLTSPPVSGMTPHGGERFGAVFASVDPPNNDWLISPKVTLGENPSISFWVKSYTAQYGLEIYNVLVSTTDLNPASFELVAGPLTAPATEWTLVTYALDEYIGQEVYVAIQCVSNDAFVFMVDDIVISFMVGTNDVPVVENLMVYPNPSNGILNVKADSKINKVQLVNIAGQVVYESNVSANETMINTTSMNKGLYLLNITSDRGVVTRKISVR